MVTATRTATRPAAGSTDVEVVGRRRAGRDELVRPEVLITGAVSQRRRVRRRRSFDRRRLVRPVHGLRLPAPLVDTSLRRASSPLESAAAIGGKIRRRDDPNP